MRRTFAGELLSFLEKREERLLSWGFYDATFEAEAVDALLGTEASEALRSTWNTIRADEGVELADLLSDMAYAGLLHEVEAGRYRTRFAETVRLLARLRQLFRAEDWATGPSLVSDIKMHLAPRRYPRRDQSPGDCWQDMLPHCRRPELQRDAFFALATGPSGEPVTFSGFQRRSFADLLERYGARGLGGSVISAGTGAGKTKAFYVPAFLALAADIAANPAPATRIVAIYPRNVLLADQLREALSEAQKLRPVLQNHGVRPITFGALLGDTPWEHHFQRGFPEGTNWEREGRGWKVPFVTSPVAPESPLLWRDDDRARGSTALYRANENTPDIPDGVLQVTREHLQRQPPDVLFLSLEMLHREMGNPDWWRTFGLEGAYRPAPRFLLLDEVHAYNALPGAQAAWVLRRWLHWLQPTALHVVGLSATLKDACQHLSLVSSVTRQNIREFSPVPDEFESEGMEYNLALKGDPSSLASLLATSIQTGMLLSRVQTSPSRAVRARQEGSLSSADFYARRVFGFSDNLDTLNRWMSDLRDAERRQLARLRLPPERRVPRESPSPEVLRRMRQAGQIWDLPLALDYDLNQSLRVTRCSSQDPGVDASSDLIIATSSLEVGYDDPQVAATLHHKRPRSLSSFIQRKGRAGRRRGTRPWTVLVFSDYGGDRWAFQNAEQYFEPEVDAQFLPVTNPYVLRIQATAFLVDWLGRAIHRGGPYFYLSRRSSQHRAAQERAVRLLQDMIAQGAAWYRFRRDFSRAFRYPRGRGSDPLDEAALDAILWEEPRPLATRVLPTLLRKLESNWAIANEAGAEEDQGFKRPLPGFLPSATFADLEVAETQLLFETTNKQPQAMSLGRALMESCPGNVSKRYATGPRERGYWHALAPQLLQGTRSFSIQNAYPDSLFVGEEDGVQVFQVLRTRLAQTTEPVKETSKATWRWRSRLRPLGTGLRLPVLIHRPWSRWVTGCEAHLHRDSSGVEVIRFAHEAEFEIQRRRQDPLVGTLTLEDAGRDGVPVPQAVGFQQQVDGLLFELDAAQINVADSLDADALARLRPEFLQYLLHHELGLNIFLAEWVCQTSVSSLAATAVAQRCDLPRAQEILSGMRDRAAERVLDSMFQIRELEDGEEPTESRLKARVLGVWRDPDKTRRIEELERSLWEPPSEVLRSWARRRAVSAFAQALRVAVVSGQKDVAEDDFEVDVLWPDQGPVRILITELHSGGLGQMEQVVESLRTNPEFFHDALRHALAHCDRQFHAHVLRQANAASVKPSHPVADAFKAAREARDLAATEVARESLKQSLADLGITPTRVATVSVAARLLRPASSPRTDLAVQLLERRWNRVNGRLGIAVEPRVFAYLCVHQGAIRRRLEALLREMGHGQSPQLPQMHALVQQLLSPGCEDSCRECLQLPNRFNPFEIPSRALVRRWLGLLVEEVDADANPSDWPDLARGALREESRVLVRVSAEQVARVSARLQAMLAEQVEVEHLLMPIVLTAVERDTRGWALLLRLQETFRAEP